MSYKCLVCGKTFGKSEDKYKHMVKEHNQKLKDLYEPEGYKRLVEKFG